MDSQTKCINQHKSGHNVYTRKPADNWPWKKDYESITRIGEVVGRFPQGPVGESGELGSKYSIDSRIAGLLLLILVYAPTFFVPYAFHDSLYLLRDAGDKQLGQAFRADGCFGAPQWAMSMALDRVGGAFAHCALYYATNDLGTLQVFRLFGLFFVLITFLLVYHLLRDLAVPSSWSTGAALVVTLLPGSLYLVSGAFSWGPVTTSLMLLANILVIRAIKSIQSARSAQAWRLIGLATAIASVSSLISPESGVLIFLSSVLLAGAYPERNRRSVLIFFAVPTIVAALSQLVSIGVSRIVKSWIGFEQGTVVLPPPYTLGVRPSQLIEKGPSLLEFAWQTTAYEMLLEPYGRVLSVAILFMTVFLTITNLLQSRRAGVQTRNSVLLLRSAVVAASLLALMVPTLAPVSPMVHTRSVIGVQAAIALLVAVWLARQAPSFLLGVTKVLAVLLLALMVTGSSSSLLRIAVDARSEMVSIESSLNTAAANNPSAPHAIAFVRFPSSKSPTGYARTSAYPQNAVWLADIYGTELLSRWTLDVVPCEPSELSRCIQQRGSNEVVVTLTSSENPYDLSELGLSPSELLIIPLDY